MSIEHIVSAFMMYHKNIYGFHIFALISFHLDIQISALVFVTRAHDVDVIAYSLKWILGRFIFYGNVESATDEKIVQEKD